MMSQNNWKQKQFSLSLWHDVLNKKIRKYNLFLDNSDDDAQIVFAAKKLNCVRRQMESTDTISNV